VKQDGTTNHPAANHHDLGVGAQFFAAAALIF